MISNGETSLSFLNQFDLVQLLDKFSSDSGAGDGLKKLPFAVRVTLSVIGGIMACFIFGLISLFCRRKCLESSL